MKESDAQILPQTKQKKKNRYKNLQACITDKKTKIFG